MLYPAGYLKIGDYWHIELNFSLHFDVYINYIWHRNRSKFVHIFIWIKTHNRLFLIWFSCFLFLLSKHSHAEMKNRWKMMSRSNSSWKSSCHWHMKCFDNRKLSIVNKNYSTTFVSGSQAILKRTSFRKSNQIYAFLLVCYHLVLLKSSKVNTFFLRRTFLQTFWQAIIVIHYLL